MQARWLFQEQALTCWDSPGQLPGVWSQTDKNSLIHWQSVVSESASAQPVNKQEKEQVEQVNISKRWQETNTKTTPFQGRITTLNRKLRAGEGRSMAQSTGDPSGDIWVDSWTPPSKCPQGLTSYKVVHSCSVVHVLKESLLKLYFRSFGVRSPRLLAAMRSPTSFICPKQNSLKSRGCYVTLIV